MERRLAAVMIADVAGYGRLSQADEEGTRARFQADLHEVFEPKVAAHHGRLVKTMGDGLLIEFHSVVDALRCAIDVQRAEAERNAGLTADRRLVFRIGINLGDVIVEGDDIHGDGVNIADRLQGLAEPGGIAISGSAYDQVKAKLAVGYADLGEQSVKNIAEPVRAYRVLLDPAAAGTMVAAAKAPARSSRRAPLAVAAFLLLLVMAGALAWWRPWQPPFKPDLPLPDKPSIAVLPFTNMSGDPQQEYFADGMTDDLITDLSQISGLFVIARNSTFSYKGRTIDPRQVAKELGVRYVLEGSVQRAGDALRINAQLIDAATNGHQWAERYDGSLADVFALQDKVTHSIADSLALRLSVKEQVSLGQHDTNLPEAYDEFLAGWELYRQTTADTDIKAIPHFEAAIRLDPNYGRAYAALAMIYRRYLQRFRQGGGLGITWVEAFGRMHTYALKAREFPTSTSRQFDALVAMWDPPQGNQAYENRSETAIAGLREAIALDPGDSWNYAYMAFALASVSRPDEALSFIGTAMRLDPHSPPFFFCILGLAQFGKAGYAEAVASLETCTRLNVDEGWALILQASANGHLGRVDAARAAVARFKTLRHQEGDKLSIIQIWGAVFYKDDVALDPVIDGLRKAGLME
ncbi:MAG TPA: adenylate/guanylate cyclase domain-containing protein [Methylomirabilota bacterium]|nr:adenylate/guanylate cyclase domain-containing protein [Methylomirabilota bacterium]